MISPLQDFERNRTRARPSKTLSSSLGAQGADPHDLDFGWAAPACECFTRPFSSTIIWSA